MNGVSRKKAWCIYTLLLIITITTNLFLPGIGNVIWIGLASSATCITSVYFLCTSSKPKQLDTSAFKAVTKQEQGTSDGQNKSESLISVNAPPPPRQPRLHYLDSIKSILTCIVVIHHTSMGFGSGGGWYYNIANYHNAYQVPSASMQVLDQSYFMCLFFFISGYFTPISCDRKGPKLFLRDKFLRLGIPFIVYQLILGPFLAFLINYLFIEKNTWAYGADAGPCWFLLWLLIFNTLYLLIDQSLPYLPLNFPSLFRLVVVFGACFGIIQYGVVAAIPEGNFIYMPITIGSLPFDILFFSCGVAAKYNGWLRQTLPTLSQCNVVFIRMMTVVCAAAVFGYLTFFYVTGIGNVGGFPKKNASDHDCDSDNDSNEWYVELVYLGFFVMSGICTPVISLTIVQFARTYLNISNKYTKFFAKSAYCVYIIHPLVVVPVTYSYQRLLYAMTGDELYFCDDTSVSKTHFSSNWFIWFGWLYSVSLSLIILWPLAWYIRQLPGLNKIL